MSEIQRNQLPEQPPIYEGDHYAVGGLPEFINDDLDYLEGDVDYSSEQDELESEEYQGEDFVDSLKAGYSDLKASYSVRKAERLRKKAERLERKKAIYGSLGTLALTGESVDATLPDGTVVKPNFIERTKARRGKQKALDVRLARTSAIVSENHRIPGVYGDKRLEKSQKKEERKMKKFDKSVLGQKKQKQVRA